MHLNGLRTHFRKFYLVAMTSALLSACHGGDGGGGSASLGGTAATGAPLDGIVYVTDASGTEVNIPINADGTFSVSVEGMTPPFMLRAIPNGRGDVLYSFASEADIIVNITPLTSLALYMAYNNDLAKLYGDWSAASDALDDAMITDEQTVINASLSGLFDYYGIDATYYDFVNTPFNADHRGIDRVLDNLVITIDPEAEIYPIVVNGKPLSVNEEEIYYTNIGDFPVDPYSTWELTISDPAFESDSVIDRNIAIAINPVIEKGGLHVYGMDVPNDRDEFEQTSKKSRYLNDKILRSINGYIYEGVEIRFDNVSVAFDVFGNGEIGTLVSGTFTGTANVTGTLEGEAINETINLNTVFTWEHLDDPYGKGHVGLLTD